MLSFGTFAAEECELSSGPHLAQEKIVFKNYKKLSDGNVWIEGVHLREGKNLFRIKTSHLNKSRICQALGFSDVSGARIEFDNNSQVVSVNKNLEIVRIKSLGTEFIDNITCR